MAPKARIGTGDVLLLPLFLFLPTWATSRRIAHFSSLWASFSSYSDFWLGWGLSRTQPLSKMGLSHLKKYHPLQLSVSLLFQVFRLLVRAAGIESNPAPVQDFCSVRGKQVHTDWVAFLCIVCDQWCYRHCAWIHSIADYRWLAPPLWSYRAHALLQSHLQHPLKW